MKTLTRMIAAAGGAMALALAVPATAQMQIYQDYEPADEVVELTMVKVDEGQLETYLNGLKSTWIAANEVQKEQGVISSYGIYTVPYGDSEFNLILRVTFPGTEMIGPSKERYMAFMEAYGKANIDKGNRTVQAIYNKIRTIQGRYMLREIRMID